MKNVFWVFVLMIVLLQIEVLGLLFLSGNSVKIWDAQLKFNDSIIQALQNK